jgi:hypothetical protein
VRIGGRVAEPIRANLGLIAILAVAAATRFAVLAWFHAPSDSVYSDMRTYHAMALRILEDVLSPQDTIRPIGYPGFLAGIYAVSRHSLKAVAIVQAFAGVLTCALTYPLARQFGLPRGWALAACALIAVYPPFVFYGTYLLTEAIAPLLMTALMVAALWSLERRSWAAAVLAGFLFACISAIRPNTLPLFPFLCAAAWIALGRFGAAVGWSGRVLVGAIPLLAFIVSLNSQLTGRLVGLSTNGGFNFFLMQTDFQGVNAFDWSFSPVLNHRHYRVMFEGPVPLYEEDYYYREGMRAVRADPVKALRRVPDHLRESWGLGFQIYWPAQPRMRDGTPRFDWQILKPCARAFFPVFVAPTALMLAVLTSRREWRRPESAAWMLVLGTLVTLTMTAVLYLADPRMHVPFDGLFIVATGAVVYRWRGLPAVGRRSAG